MFPVVRSSLATSVLRLLFACLVLTAVLYAPAAQAVQPFVVKDIRIEGLQRSDPGTVFGALPFRIGDTYTDEKGATAVEYGLMVALIAIVIIAAVIILGTRLSSIFASVGNSI